MKKILLSCALVMSIFISQAQTVLNEVYTDPGGTNSEFIELYNSSLVGSQSVDCFTILTYWESGTGQNVVRGWYVLDLPVGTVASKGFYTLAAASPFTTQNTPLGTPANLNWNDPTFRSGSTGGYLKKVQAGGFSGYTDISGTIPASLNDLMSPGSFSGGPHYVVLVFVNGVFNNGFVGGGSINLPADIQNMPDLTVTPAGTCGANFVVDFSTLGAMEFVGQTGGSNNGYARTSDGKCGAWEKTAPGIQHTPGSTNGSAAGLTGALTTAQFVTCDPAFAIANFDISAVSGDASEAADLPTQLQLYRDVNFNGLLDGPDTIMGSKMINTIAAPADTIRFPLGSGILDVFFVYRTKRGCFDKVVLVQQTCATLPVKLKSFTATRNGTTVTLKWETVTEENNRGFHIQRHVGNSGWQTVGFVATRAAGGNSTSSLTYEFSEMNTTKGITQYRLRQEDIDGTPSLSAIRAVRGEEQKGKTIIYPNPTIDGKVSVVFEDVNVIRDVSLIDMNGRTLKQWRGITSNTIQIDNLNAGFYTLRIVNTATNEQIVEKIVVNKR